MINHKPTHYTAYFLHSFVVRCSDKCRGNGWLTIIKSDRALHDDVRELAHMPDGQRCQSLDINASASMTASQISVITRTAASATNQVGIAYKQAGRILDAPCQLNLQRTVIWRRGNLRAAA